MNFTEQELKAILSKDPFEGDRDISPRYLKNKMGKARKYAQCRNCLTNIHPGDTARIMSVAFSDGDGIVHGKFCIKCCEAIAKDSEDGGDRFASRYTREAA